jgi:hypothetical protein
MQIIKKSEAIKIGLKHYFTGKPCKRGHVSKRRISSNDCCVCSTLRQTQENSRKSKSQYYQKNKDKILKETKLRYEKNKDQRLEYAKKYQKENIKKILLRQNKWAKEKAEKDYFFALRRRLRSRLRSALKKIESSKKGTKTLDTIGCTSAELILHFESLFLEGMNWNNRNLWHIDHIIPLSSASTEDELIKLNHYTNLQPLWAIDNLKKSNKLE